MASRPICWLSDLGDDRLDLVGGKAANLGRLLRLGLPVPRGFVVTTEAYRVFIAENHLAGADPAGLRSGIVTAPIPSAVSTAILDAYWDMDGPTVAVRSSGTAEDLATASFAGQHDTFLDVVGPEAVLDAVRRCWASLWSERAIAYRRQQGWDGRDLALAVVIQTMVPAEWAGVLFTADPVTGRRDRIVVEAVAGLGEALVSGQKGGQRVVLEKGSGRLLEGRAPLPEAALAELADWGTRAEDAFGRPQDVEWACASTRCFLLQARPLTALREEAGPAELSGPHDYSRLQRAAAPNALDHVPVPPYPFDYSLFFRPLLGSVVEALGHLGIAGPPVDGLFREVASGVYQIVPPNVRLTPRALSLPLKLVASLGQRPERWLEECRQGPAALAERIDGENLAALSDPELLERIEALSRRQLELALPRFARFPRGLLASQALSFLVRLTAGSQAPELERNLLAAIPCVTTRANHDLQQLARQIRASRELRRMFQEESPDQLPARLREWEAGRIILAQIDEYLQHYGARETTMPSAALPAWRDDPRLVFGLLKGLVAGEPVAQPVEGDDEARAAQARLALASMLSRRWLGLGRLLLPLTLRLLDASRAFLAFREDSHFCLLRPFSVLRRVALELGRRLVARGTLEEAEDIFFLKFEEIKALGSGATAWETVRKRKDARRSLGDRFPSVPVELLEQAGGSGPVVGAPASRGQAVGRVRVIWSERDFSQLQKGEVLVAPYTNPTWTPLFALAAAVVVDAGGAASHAAIVAREYGIPAVMGAGNATTRLRDGQRVLVDGEKGRVVPLPESAS